MPTQPRKQPAGKTPARHGFYSELFTAPEQALLDDPIALEDEQKLLRVRVLRLARRITAEGDLKDELGSVTALLRMIQAIATLERVRLVLHGKGDETGRAIVEALGELDPFEEL